MCFELNDKAPRHPFRILSFADVESNRLPDFLFERRLVLNKRLQRFSPVPAKELDEEARRRWLLPVGDEALDRAWQVQSHKVVRAVARRRLVWMVEFDLLDELVPESAIEELRRTNGLRLSCGLLRRRHFINWCRASKRHAVRTDKHFALHDFGVQRHGWHEKRAPTSIAIRADLDESELGQYAALCGKQAAQSLQVATDAIAGDGATY